MEPNLPDMLALGRTSASTDSNEPDLKDECLVPHEGTFKSLIKDDELYTLFNKYVDLNIKLTAIYDCCHSGTMLREVIVDDDGKIVEDVINRYLDIGDFSELRVRDSVIGPYNILSGCRDEETAADLRRAGPERLPRGAFSYALHNFLQVSRDVSVALAEPQILGGIRAVSKHNQNPSYTVIDVNSPLIRY